MRYLLGVFLLFSTFVSNAQIDIDKLDQIVANHIEDKQFEGTVLVADKGQIVYQKTHGFASRVNKIPINDQTHFSIASITKMLTAIIVLQLIEEGKLSLENSLDELLPELQIPNAKQISIHHLLLHISGLPNEIDNVYRKVQSPNEMVASAVKNKQKGLKLGKFNYNNIDYIILGLIIERLTAESWEETVKSRIINPLKLKHTGFLKKGQYPDDFAWTYQLTEEGSFTKDPAFHIENFYAAGSMYSNAEDLLKIDQAMYGETLLKAESKKRMFNSYPEYNYTGYSVWTYRYPFIESKPKIMERRGGILGANVVLIRLLELNQTIIILSNNDGFNPDSFGDKNNLREAIIRALGSNLATKY